MTTAQSVLWHPTTERIFELEDLQVPPQNYATFLEQTVEGFIQLVLQYHDVQTLDEVVEKYKRELIAANPNISEEGLVRHVGSPLVISFSGQLRYHAGGSVRVPNEVYPSPEHTEDLFEPGGTEIPFGEYRQQLIGLVETIRQELDKRYPDREGHIPDGLLGRGDKEDQDIRQYLYGFGFDLHLESRPHSLETHISLRDDGARGPIIPGISIRARTLVGGLEFSQAVVDTLGELVTTSYQTKDIENRQSSVSERS